MPYTFEKFRKDYLKKNIVVLEPEERLKGLKAEERLKGLTRAEIENYLKKLDN